jgi:hypothetical protein
MIVYSVFAFIALPRYSVLYLITDVTQTTSLK